MEFTIMENDYEFLNEINDNYSNDNPDFIYNDEYHLDLLFYEEDHPRPSSPFGRSNNKRDEKAFEISVKLFDYDSDGNGTFDPNSWMKKAKREWDKTDTINWLLFVSGELGHCFGLMSDKLGLPGKDLLRLSKQDFRNYDPYFGEEIYDLLHEDSDTFRSRISETGFDADCRVKKNQTKKKKGRRPNLPKFVKELLLNPVSCPAWICWENYEEKTFRFVQGGIVAKLWGKLNNRPNMTYQKFTRALRYYYKKTPHELDGIFVSVNERLVYKFGDWVEGLETDDPNFIRTFSAME